jgi:CRP/FNR family cyclic AMP-dependent transcriptional regulator
MANKRTKSVDPIDFLQTTGEGKKPTKYRENKIVFSQGDPADSVFYIHEGKIKLSVLSQGGKEAVIGLLGHGDFFGEACLTAQLVCMCTATAVTDCLVTRLNKAAMIAVLRDKAEVSSVFMSHLLARNIRMQEDLVDQLFNSSEKRLARILLLLANFGKEGSPQEVIPKVSQATLAEMVGTTRSRVSTFMNKFRKLGFIDYHDRLEVHSSLLNVVLHD